MEGVIVRLKLLNKERTAENYAATLKSFMRFREDSDVLLLSLIHIFSFFFESFSTQDWTAHF